VTPAPPPRRRSISLSNSNTLPKLPTGGNISRFQDAARRATERGNEAFKRSISERRTDGPNAKQPSTVGAGSRRPSISSSGTGSRRPSIASSGTGSRRPSTVGSGTGSRRPSTVGSGTGQGSRRPSIAHAGADSVSQVAATSTSTARMDDRPRRSGSLPNEKSTTPISGMFAGNQYINQSCRSNESQPTQETNKASYPHVASGPQVYGDQPPFHRKC
jgi:hypothetical protein